MKVCVPALNDRPIYPDELVVIALNKEFPAVAVFVVIPIKPAPPDTVKEDNAVIPVIVPKFNVFVPETAIDLILLKPFVVVSIFTVLVAEALLLVIFKAVSYELV